MNDNVKICLEKYIKINVLGGNMKIKNLDIVGIGGIKELKLNFDDKFNVICGANGIGKTTILNIISHTFSAGSTKLKRNAQCSEGHYNITYIDKGETRSNHAQIETFIPDEQETGGYNSSARYLLRFDVDRNYEYVKLSQISSDPKRSEIENSSVVSQGVKATDIKNWFVNRFAFHDKEGSLSPEEVENYHLAKKCLAH